jgi:hypothetical protein
MFKSLIQNYRSLKIQCPNTLCYFVQTANNSGNLSFISRSVKRDPEYSAISIRSTSTWPQWHLAEQCVNEATTWHVSTTWRINILMTPTPTPWPKFERCSAHHFPKPFTRQLTLCRQKYVFNFLVFQLFTTHLFLYTCKYSFRKNWEL